MKLNDRIKTITEWGGRIASLPSSEKDTLFQKAYNKNGWFTPSGSENAINGILPWLQAEVLQNWLSHYSLPDGFSKKTVGLVMAGNIPLVGFHDFLSVLLSGHMAKIKLSSQDDALLPYLTSLLTSIDNRWENRFSFEDRLNHVDAVIATGSDNSARYFEYYFRNIPKIIRKNRTSVGIVMGEETSNEFQKLGRDVFSYFGLGCRNVSKVFVPDDFDLGNLMGAFQEHQDVINHHKYANNYDYQKAIRLISGKKFLDGDFLIMEKSSGLVSPIAVLYYEHYANVDHLYESIAGLNDKLQCIVSAKRWFKGSIAFGEAQTPHVDDYADNIDTMKFLESF